MQRESDKNLSTSFFCICDGKYNLGGCYGIFYFIGMALFIIPDVGAIEKSAPSKPLTNRRVWVSTYCRRRPVIQIHQCMGWILKRPDPNENIIASRYSKKTRYEQYCWMSTDIMRGLWHFLGFSSLIAIIMFFCVTGIYILDIYELCINVV